MVVVCASLLQPQSWGAVNSVLCSYTLCLSFKSRGGRVCVFPGDFKLFECVRDSVNFVGCSLRCSLEGGGGIFNDYPGSHFASCGLHCTASNLHCGGWPCSKPGA